ncbi:hypothetical protein HMPREF1531_01588 [Propionibacterium sp. oral taxon 192 str. F0372]|nr:hypothetical protein HMPREF1531_01588 [Propionibacterium sp. oral taxon 192 str. F0372]
MVAVYLRRTTSCPGTDVINQGSESGVQLTEKSKSTADAGATGVQSSARTSANRPMGITSRPASSNSGFIMTLIVGALALVFAFAAVIIALGRAPQPAAQAAAKASAESAAPGTTYSSPNQTGERYTAEPIQTNGTAASVYEPPVETPSHTPSASHHSPSPSDDGEEEEEEDPPVSHPTNR